MLRTVIVRILCGAACCQPALAQVFSMTVLEIDIENFVEYQTDIPDISKSALNPGITPSAGILQFAPAIAIGDIVAVNGEPVKGTVFGRPWTLSVTPEQAQIISDTPRVSTGFRTFEILKPDGTPIGTLMVLGLNGGTSPPGPNFGGQNFAIVGGTGAFLGARGQQGGRQIPGFTIPPRAASIAENPVNRRRIGGGRVRWLLAVIPMSRPEVVTANGEPMIVHASDSKLVTASNPAAAGETLVLFATGLGPTAPGVDFGQPFPSSPLATVNSPLKVTVNGNPAEVILAAGFPGRVDTYEVQFRVPAGIPAGTAAVGLIAAWMPGTAVTIPIR